MPEREFRRTMAVFPIGSVMTLTDLSARQIRYYEDQGLIKPDRSKSNRRLYSLNDMDRLLEIKDYIDDGFTIADIRQKYAGKVLKARQQKPLSDADIRRLLHKELTHQSGFTTASPNPTTVSY